MPLVILHYLLNVFVQLANKRGFKQKKNFVLTITPFPVDINVGLKWNLKKYAPYG
jgi:hypothetical protein